MRVFVQICPQNDEVSQALQASAYRNIIFRKKELAICSTVRKKIARLAEGVSSEKFK